MANFLNFLQEVLDKRFKIPYVTKDYDEEDKNNVIKGIELAVNNACKKNKELNKEITKEEILNLYKTMNPSVEKSMVSPLKGIVAFQNDQLLSEEELKELFDWSEKNSIPSQGPCFVVIKAMTKEAIPYKSISEIRQGFGVKSNAGLALKILWEFKPHPLINFLFIPFFDSQNIDKVTLSLNELESYKKNKPNLIIVKDSSLVTPKFDALLLAFNQIKNPTLEDIAAFIKDMILLYPFPDGNGRVFTLGVLNQLLLQNGYGLCLTLNPKICFLSVKEITAKINRSILETVHVMFESLDKEFSASAWQRNALAVFLHGFKKASAPVKKAQSPNVQALESPKTLQKAYFEKNLKTLTAIELVGLLNYMYQVQDDAIKNSRIFGVVREERKFPHIFFGEENTKTWREMVHAAKTALIEVIENAAEQISVDKQSQYTIDADIYECLERILNKHAGRWLWQWGDTASMKSFREKFTQNHHKGSP